MKRFLELVSGYKRFAIAAVALVSELGGFIPEKYQGAAVVTVAVLTAGTKVADTIMANSQP